MQTTNRLWIITVSLVLAGLRPAKADEGMWLFNRPPVKLLSEKYGFEPTPQWLEHIQKSCLRFSNGGSASIVSADGLVLTNHHVGAGSLEKLSTPERNLLETGFYAKTRDEELPVPDIELMVLWSIADVTDRVKGCVSPGMSPADANTARRKIMTVIEQEAEEESGLDCQVVTLYQGGWYHLYSYKRYTDVRLVMAPEQQIAFFGGDNDNFEFPRFVLDMCFFRIYEDGEPLRAKHYLRFSHAGAAEKELVFVSGHPARTRRLYTVDHLRFLRDVELPAVLHRLWRREVQLMTFSARSDENARIATGDSLGVQNARKAYTGMLAGLYEPKIMQAKIAAEKRLRAAVDANPRYKQEWADAWDQVTAAERDYREFYLRYSALEGRRRSALSSDLFNIARRLVRLADEKLKPNTERLREYRDSELDSLNLKLFSPAPIYDDLEINRIASGLSYLVETFGADDPLVVKALAAQSPRARAESLVRGSKLKEVEERQRLANGGHKAIASSTDPMIRLAAELDPAARALRKRYEDEIEGAEREAYAKIAAAQFAVQGEAIYPDATFTLRLAMGRVEGYQEGNRYVHPFTTLGGAYEHMKERNGLPPYELTKRWLKRKNKLNLDTPYNFVCTADIIGGNSGSPVINRAGEVVGLIFDGNIYSLVFDIAYTQTVARAIAVDSRAIIECLRKLYDAGSLADELTRR